MVRLRYLHHKLVGENPRPRNARIRVDSFSKLSSEQESLANAKVNARQHCVSLSCLCNSLTHIEWLADFSIGDEDSENIASERYKKSAS